MCRHTIFGDQSTIVNLILSLSVVRLSLLLFDLRYVETEDVLDSLPE